MLIPFYILGERAGGLEAFIFLVRLPILLLTALLGAVFFLFVFDLTLNPRAALAAWLVFSFTGPILFFSGLIYPEMAAALITLLVFRHLLFKKNGRPSVILLSGLGLALLPWFGIKYAILAVALYLPAAFSYLKKPAANLGKMIRLSIFPLVSTVLFLYFIWSCYGRLNPASVYSGAEMSSRLSVIRPTSPTNIQSFASAGLSPFFEQKTGVFVHAPVYFLALAGFFLLWKKRKAAALELLIVFGAYSLMGAAAFFLGGYSPPGRPFLPVMWILAAFVSMALAAPAGRLAALVKWSLAGLSALIAGFALSVPELLYHLNVGPRAGNVLPESHFLAAADNLFFNPQKWTPSLSASSTLSGGPLAAWILALLLVTALVLWPRKNSSALRVSFRPAGRTSIVLAFSVLFLAGVFFNVRLENPVFYKAEGYALFFQDQNQYGSEQGGFWTKGTAETSVVLQSPTRLSKIALSLSSEVSGQAEVRIDRFRASIRHDPKIAPENKYVFDSPRGFPWKGAYLYLIRIRDRAAFVPHQLDRRVEDNRTLGVFVKIAGTKSAS